jgi:hypothetical protein
VSGGSSAGPVHHRGPGFWITAAAGWALIGWGLRGVLRHHVDTRPGQLLRFFATGLGAHDLLFAPVVLAAGIVVARTVPARWRATVQGTLLVAGTTALFAYPLVRGYGRALHNPTSLPRDYAAGLGIVLAVVAAGGLAANQFALSRFFAPLGRVWRGLRRIRG